jgi:hypothetical protein
MALFSYSNPNATPVYIPRGVDNQVVNREAGQNNGSEKLPQVFQPGAYHEVVILFQGQQMQWEVKSMDAYHKTAVASEVNQTSPRCDAITVMTRVAEQVSEGVDGEGMNTVYPNPAKNKVRISLGDASANEKALVLMTADGRVTAARGVQRTGKYSIDMDVSHLASGVYLLRIPGKLGVTVLRFTKL